MMNRFNGLVVHTLSSPLAGDLLDVGHGSCLAGSRRRGFGELELVGKDGSGSLAKSRSKKLRRSDEKPMRHTFGRNSSMLIVDSFS